jgi:hypothetical protein
MALPIQTILIRQLAGYLGEPLFLALLSTRSHLRPGIADTSGAGCRPRPLRTCIRSTAAGSSRRKYLVAMGPGGQGRRVRPSRNKQEPAQRSISPAS